MTREVKIYTKAGCPFCTRAKQLFERLGVKYEEVPVDDRPELREELREKHGWPTVPAIFIGGQCVGGFTDVAKLEAAGRLAELLARVE